MSSNLQRVRSLPTPLPPPIHQHGAYGLIFDRAGRVLVVRTASGRCYLPGGRVEPEEHPQAALAREVAEECGWSVVVDEWVCAHAQPIFDGRISLQANYWRARLAVPLAGVPEHVNLWLSPSEALTRLHRASDRSALAAAIA